MPQVIAIDWSGRASGEGEAIWLARAVDGRLEELENGWARGQVVARAIGLAEQDRQTLVGLDFAFGFPGVVLEARGLELRARGVAGRASAARSSSKGQVAFWGRSGSSAQTLGDPHRATEKEHSKQAKSVFQISGAGAVGMGSLRGMPHLLDFTDAGFAVWPFDEAKWPLVVEIYPRLLTGEVVKTRHRSRRQYMDERFPDKPERLRERAAGSEDALDAAVSALVIARHMSEADTFPPLDERDERRLEGAIWPPPATSTA